MRSAAEDVQLQELINEFLSPMESPLFDTMWPADWTQDFHAALEPT
jgi:hypothetical protein